MSRSNLQYIHNKNDHHKVFSLIFFLKQATDIIKKIKKTQAPYFSLSRNNYVKNNE